MNKIDIAIEALNRIKSPISFMQKELKEGEHLNGVYAVQLARDANYLQSIAKKALTEIDESPSLSSAEEAIEFAEWKEKNYRGNGPLYYNEKDSLKSISETEYFNIPELYNLYKQSKK